MSTIATWGRGARTLRRRSSASPDSATTSKPASSRRRTAAARKSRESSAIATRIAGSVGIGVQVQDELDRRVGAVRAEALAARRALDRDADDRGPEAARLGGGRRVDPPAARGELLGDGPL